MKTCLSRPAVLVIAVAVMGLAACGAEGPARPGPEKLIVLGEPMPSFELPDVVTGKNVSSASLAGKRAQVVIFMCRHCPFVVHVLDGLVAFGNDYKDKDVAIVGISSNDAEKFKPDSPESLKEMALEKKLPFPLLYDESQKVAHAFTAVCTPEFYVFDAQGILRYHGQFDDSRPGKKTPVTGADVRAAVDALLAGQPVASEQKRAVGCTIKWKEGNRPAYVK